LAVETLASRRRRARRGALAAALLLLFAFPAAAAGYAPPDRPGPLLSVPAAKLAAALSCHGSLAGAKQ
jgi:hypothetical protein